MFSLTKLNLTKSALAKFNVAKLSLTKLSLTKLAHWSLNLFVRSPPEPNLVHQKLVCRK